MCGIDRLYRLPLSEFTAARNALAGELRAAGDREEAERVRRLAKPSIGAWLVNRLFFEHRKRFDALLGAADAQRRSLRQRGAMSSEAGARQREAVRDLLEAARGEAEAAGSSWTPALRQRVARSLEAIAAAPPDSPDRPGRLTTDLEPAGFDALLGAAIAESPPDRARGATERKRKRAPSAAVLRRRKEAAERVEAARKEVAAARRKRSAAKKALVRKEGGAERTERAARKAEEAAERARSRAHEADLDRRKARSAVGDAERRLARAERSLAEETRKLEALAGD